MPTISSFALDGLFTSLSFGFLVCTMGITYQLHGVAVQIKQKNLHESDYSLEYSEVYVQILRNILSYRN